MQQKN